MSKHVKIYQPPTSEEITACAHRIYKMEGQPEGRAMEHWLQAEAQLIAERQAQAGLSTAKAMPKLAAGGASNTGKTRNPVLQTSAPESRQSLQRN